MNKNQQIRAFEKFGHVQPLSQTYEISLILIFCWSTFICVPMKGESVGYTVKSMDKEFPISNYPLEQTEFLYDSKLGTVDFFRKKFSYKLYPQ